MNLLDARGGAIYILLFRSKDAANELVMRVTMSVGVPDILRWTKADEGQIDDPHPTYRVAKFIAEFGAYNKIQYVNLSKNSLLKEYMPTITIDQAIHDTEKAVTL